MYPPIFTAVKDDPDVQADLGTNPCRVYPFGEAPSGVAKPYAVWQIVTGLPQNAINQLPDIDNYLIQIDIYGDSISTVREAAQSLRDAIEPLAHVVAIRGDSKEPDTNLFRYSFDVSWWVDRDLVELDSVGDSN